MNTIILHSINIFHVLFLPEQIQKSPVLFAIIADIIPSQSPDNIEIDTRPGFYRGIIDSAIPACPVSEVFTFAAESIYF